MDAEKGEDAEVGPRERERERDKRVSRRVGWAGPGCIGRCQSSNLGAYVIICLLMQSRHAKLQDGQSVG